MHLHDGDKIPLPIEMKMRLGWVSEVKAKQFYVLA
jgi:hypothetical protein